jgi:hypothetical protein
MTIIAEPPRAAAHTSVPRLRALRYEPPPGAPWPLPAAPTIPEQRRRPDASPPEPPERDEALHGTAVTVLRLVLEVLDGHRPPAHLHDHLARPALRSVRAAGRRGSGRSRLTSVRVCRPTTRAAEVAAVYRLDGRARAVAARFEIGSTGSWRCVVLRLG